MKLRITQYWSILALSTLLVSCSQPAAPNTTFGSGEVLPSASGSTLSSQQSQATSSEASSSSVTSDTEYVSPQAALELVYENAVFVQELTISVWGDLSVEEQEILEPVLEVFSQDIETLGYYLDVSQHEQLTDEELELVLNLMVDMEEAMELLAQAIEQLL